MKSLLILVSMFGLLVAGGLPEDIVKEEPVKGIYTVLPDKPEPKPVILPPRPEKPVAPLFTPIEEVGSPIPPQKKVIAPVAIAAPITAVATASILDNFFAEVGVGVGTSRESANYYTRCNGKECTSDSHTNIPVLGRIGYNVTDIVDVYTELAAYRSEIISATVENADISLGARYTAYDAFKVFGSLGKQKTTIHETKLRNIYKLGVGYNITDALSSELTFYQTDKAKFKDYNLKSRGAALFLVYNF